MIFSFEHDWKKYTEVNNTVVESIDYGIGKVLIVNDFLKYPDKLLDLCKKLSFYTSSTKDIIRPGKSFPLYPDYLNNYGINIGNFLSKTLGCFDVNFSDIIVNCFNGDMKTWYEYPHTDVVDFDTSKSNSHIAGNIGLTPENKSGTGFWSFNDKISILDMNVSEFYDYKNFFSSVIYENTSTNQPKKWRQIINEGPWKLEFICPLEYNSYVLYSSTNFHSLYMNPEWYIDKDRISIATFIDVTPNDINHSEFNDFHKQIWNNLKLDTIFNQQF